MSDMPEEVCVACTAVLQKDRPMSIQRSISDSNQQSAPGVGVASFSLDGLVHAIDEAVSNGEGVLGPANLFHEIERQGWMLVDDRDPAGTEPNNETLIEIIIDAWNDAMMDGMGNFSKYRLEYQLKRHDLMLLNANPCILGKCTSPRTCNDFSECDAKFARTLSESSS